MPVALTGGLIGAVAGLLLFGIEYVVLRGAMGDRTKRMRRPPRFDVAERDRITRLAMFALCLPPAFAVASWYLWG